MAKANAHDGSRARHGTRYRGAAIVFLLISILFTTVFASGYKLASNLKCGLQAVNVFLYAGALSTLLLYMLVTRHWDMNPQALLMGVVAGVMNYAATMAFLIHMRQGQLSASWTVISMAVAFPVVASIFAWHEYPTTRQIVGMLLMLASLVLFGRHEAGKGEKG